MYVLDRVAKVASRSCGAAVHGQGCGAEGKRGQAPLKTTATASALAALAATKGCCSRCGAVATQYPHPLKPPDPAQHQPLGASNRKRSQLRRMTPSARKHHNPQWSASVRPLGVQHVRQMGPPYNGAGRLSLDLDRALPLLPWLLAPSTAGLCAQCLDYLVSSTL